LDVIDRKDTGGQRNGEQDRIVVALLAPGNMGSGVGGRLRRNGG
jgi:hypothetical protein